MGGPQSDTIVYNGEGLRTGMAVNGIASTYLYDGTNVVGERDSAGNAVKTYTRGLGFLGGIGGLIAQNDTVGGVSEVQYYQYDDLGSVDSLTTEAGSTVGSYRYDAFGNALESPEADTSTYRFSTKEFDARSGLYYFGARYYDPEVGRWLTPDPAGFVDGLNGIFMLIILVLRMFLL